MPFTLENIHTRSNHEFNPHHVFGDYTFIIIATPISSFLVRYDEPMFTWTIVHCAVSVSLASVKPYNLYNIDKCDHLIIV